MTESWRERARRRMREISETQNALSEKLDMTQGGLQHWLAGTRQPALDDINRIAVALRCSPAWLTHGLDAQDTTDGLQDPAQAVLRRLIASERAGPLPPSFWAAVAAMADTVAPAAATATETGQHAPTYDHAPRNGTHG